MTGQLTDHMSVGVTVKIASNVQAFSPTSCPKEMFSLYLLIVEFLLQMGA